MSDERYPQRRYYRDGIHVIVRTDAERDALVPGHAATPLGPFDDGLEGRCPWEPGGGPFAAQRPPYTAAQKRTFRRGGGVEHAPTGRWFVNRETRDAYAATYEARKRSVLGTGPAVDLDAYYAVPDIPTLTEAFARGFVRPFPLPKE